MLSGAGAAEPPGQYNVIWESPSKLASGQMPIGDGDIAAGVYAIEDGDLYLLLSKNDAYTYNGDLFKTGRVRVSLNPNPFRQFGLGHGTRDLVSWTMEHRTKKDVVVHQPQTSASSSAPRKSSPQPPSHPPPGNTSR